MSRTVHFPRSKNVKSLKLTYKSLNLLGSIIVQPERVVTTSCDGGTKEDDSVTSSLFCDVVVGSITESRRISIYI